jgi:hypothetical protein
MKKRNRDVESSVWIVSELHTVHRGRKVLYVLQGLLMEGRELLCPDVYTFECTKSAFPKLFFKWGPLLLVRMFY